MYSNRFAELRKAYQSERGDKMNDDQFAVLLYTFPSILVALADGRIDIHEKHFMKRLPEVLTESTVVAGDEEPLHAMLTDDYFKEAEYITRNLDKWQDQFLDALREELHAGLDERNAIFQSMWRTADSSDDISTAERKKIDEIAAKLAL
jgi:hypothetical protein